MHSLKAMKFVWQALMREAHFSRAGHGGRIGNGEASGPEFLLIF